MLAIFSSFSGLGFLAILRARRYLVYGVPTPAHVMRLSGQRGLILVDHEFKLAEGATYRGRYSVQAEPPPEGSMVCVLYQPGNPRRNTAYPIGLTRLRSA